MWHRSVSAEGRLPIAKKISCLCGSGSVESNVWGFGEGSQEVQMIFLSVRITSFNYKPNRTCREWNSLYNMSSEVFIAVLNTQRHGERRDTHSNVGTKVQNLPTIFPKRLSWCIYRYKNA